MDQKEDRYQLVTFFDRRPELGEYVYQGENGWYPQVALKRRFTFNGISEDAGLAKIQEHLRTIKPFKITFGQRLKPSHMPVEVIEVVDSPEVVSFHRGFIKFMGDTIISGHPDREDENYYPHLTVTWNGKDVVDTADFVGTTKEVDTVWVLKDGEGQDSIAYKAFSLVLNA